MRKVDERSKELLRTELAELQQKYRIFFRFMCKNSCN